MENMMVSMAIYINNLIFNLYSGQEKEMVKSVTYFVSEEFNERTYESCKNVQFPAQSDTVMGLLCGSHGSKKCTAKRSV